MFQNRLTAFKQEQALVAEVKQPSKMHHSEQMPAQGISPAMLSGEQKQCLCIGGQADLVTSDHDLQIFIRNQKNIVRKLTW